MRVLVTRPEPGSIRTASRLAEMGHQPVILPLTRIERLAAEPTLPIETDIVALTSANAIRQASPSLLAEIRHLPFIAVGPATAAAARDLLIDNVTDVDGDSKDLARAIARMEHVNRVLYLCGRVRTPHMEAILDRAGIAVQVLETYDAVDLPNPLEALQMVTGEDTPDVVLVYSATTARLIKMLLDDLEGGRILGGATFCCISWRVAEELRPSATARVLVSDSQNEAALLGLLAGL